MKIIGREWMEPSINKTSFSLRIVFIVSLPHNERKLVLQKTKNKIRIRKVIICPQGGTLIPYFIVDIVDFEVEVFSS